MATEQHVQLNYLNIAPRKVRLIAGVLRGLRATEAEARLLLLPQRSARPLLKLLRSAVASAKNNQKADPSSLVISEIRVDPGPILKRSLPRSMGRATPIHKKTSHVHMTLRVGGAISSRFLIVPPVKKEKKEGKVKAEKPKKQSTADEGRDNQRKGGFFKRVFQRKSV